MFGLALSSLACWLAQCVGSALSLSLSFSQALLARSLVQTALAHECTLVLAGSVTHNDRDEVRPGPGTSLSLSLALLLSVRQKCDTSPALTLAGCGVPNLGYRRARCASDTMHAFLSSFSAQSESSGFPKGSKVAGFKPAECMLRRVFCFEIVCHLCHSILLDATWW